MRFAASVSERIPKTHLERTRLAPHPPRLSGAVSRKALCGRCAATSREVRLGLLG